MSNINLEHCGKREIDLDSQEYREHISSFSEKFRKWVEKELVEEKEGDDDCKHIVIFDLFMAVGKFLHTAINSAKEKKVSKRDIFTNFIFPFTPALSSVLEDDIKSAASILATILDDVEDKKAYLVNLQISLAAQLFGDKANKMMMKISSLLFAYYLVQEGKKFSSVSERADHLAKCVKNFCETGLSACGIDCLVALHGDASSVDAAFANIQKDKKPS